VAWSRSASAHLRARFLSAAWRVTGHPLNYAALDLSQAGLDAMRAALHIAGVGQTITLTLSGPDDTKVKGHGCLK
jgi:hypothetical protein